jgi:hypothetical protein
MYADLVIDTSITEGPESVARIRALLDHTLPDADDADGG